MSATMTTVAGILKEVYEGDVRNQLQESQVTSKRIQKRSDGIFETPGGKYVVFPVRHRRNHGISYRAENTQLAAAGRQGYLQAQETLRYGYGRIRLTGQVMELAKTNAQAFMNAVDGEVDGMKNDLSRDQNRIMVGNRAAFAVHGFTGVLARLTSTSTLTTITVDNTFWVEPEMIIDIVDNTGVAVSGGSGRRVVAVTSATQFTVDANVAGATNGNNVVRTGNWAQEPFGVLNLLNNTGTVHNINSATAGNEFWRTTIDTTTTLTEPAMVKVVDDIRRVSGKHPTAVFCSLGVRRSYYNLLISQRRYADTKEYTGGLVGLAFNYEKEIPVVTDVDFPTGMMAFINEDDISIYRSKDWYWADDDGSMLKYVHDYDAWEALMKCYWQMVVHQRNAHALMTSVVEA